MATLTPEVDTCQQRALLPSIPVTEVAPSLKYPGSCPAFASPGGVWGGGEGGERAWGGVFLCGLRLQEEIADAGPQWLEKDTGPSSLRLGLVTGPFESDFSSPKGLKPEVVERSHRSSQ